MKLLKMANPIAVTKGAVGLAGTAVGVLETVARGTTHLVRSGLHHLGQAGEQPAGATDTDWAGASDATGPASEPADAGTPSSGGPVTEDERAPKGPTIVAVEPHAPDEPPIDVVGEALAAEARQGDRESPEGAGVAHEPRGASRDEEHGDASWQRAEAEGIADEVAAALDDDDASLEADLDPGLDPDLDPEGHLTEPLLDPAEAKRLATEMETSARAADPHKG